MKLLRQSEHRRMPWKNGGGETIEIAVHPHEAALSEFGWRVSMAMVAQDGPFSVFPDIDRTLACLTGAGITPHVEGREAHTLTPASDPFAFPGDVATRASLTSGPITDLNVMTRRGGYRHEVERRNIEGRLTLPGGAGETIVLCAAGVLNLHASGRNVSLGALDAVRAGAVSFFEIEGRGVCFAIRLAQAEKSTEGISS